MQPPHRTTPFDLPELVAIIIRYLGFRDKIACLFVCRRWHEFFRNHVFGEQVLHKLDAQHPTRLQAVGRYARDLKAYFAVGDLDLSIVSTHCPNILALDVEVDQYVTDKNFEEFMECMSIQHLVLRIRHRLSAHKRLASVTRLQRIKSLDVRSFCPVAICIQPERLVTLLQAMPSLSSLFLNIQFQGQIDRLYAPYPSPPTPPQQIPSVFLTDAASSSSTPGEHITLPPPRTPYWSRLSGFFKKPKEFAEGSLQAVQVQEPWRTFIPRVFTTEELRRLTPHDVPASHGLFDQPLDLTTAIPSLTTLHVFEDSTLEFGTLANALFPLLPSLRELVLDFGCRRDGSSKGLAAVIPNCPDLQSLTIYNLDCVPDPTDYAPALQVDAQKAVKSFLSNLPPTLRELTLKRVYVDDMKEKPANILLCIPTETRKHLHKLVAERLDHQQAATHDFLVGCQSLGELRLAEFVSLQRTPSSPAIPIHPPLYYSTNSLYQRSDYFLGSILEPWSCTWTLECVDLEGYPIIEQDAMAAWLDRLARMPRLSKLVLSVHQVKLMLKARRQRIPSVDGADDVLLQHVRQLRLNMASVTTPPPCINVGRMHWSEGTLGESELRELLEMMPRVSSLRYIGHVYPLFHDAARWLEENRPHLQVLHVLQ
ncbi:hypothetical protein DFQ26_006956 [Actinomortierella ambigua]|nr:hypothetical protein DFQ26_006956 [Actinomortierella ambigua]